MNLRYEVKRKTAYDGMQSHTQEILAFYFVFKKLHNETRDQKKNKVQIGDLDEISQSQINGEEK